MSTNVNSGDEENSPDLIVQCRVCGSMIDISNKKDQHVVKCEYCNEATPIRNPPPGQKYIRCPCNCLLICKSTAQRISCPRPSCHKIIVLYSPTEKNTPNPNDISPVPGMCQVSCGHCNEAFLFNSLVNQLARCPHCEKKSSVGREFARARGLIFSFLALITLVLAIVVTVVTHGRIDNAYIGWIVLYSILYLVSIYFIFRITRDHLNSLQTSTSTLPPTLSVIYAKYSPDHLLMCMIAQYSNDRMTDNYENVNHLVLNFYPDGYSIAVKLNEFPVFTSETILETAKIPYEETGLLDYIANEELPPLLVEMIDNSPKLSQYKIWRNGCLIIEVRDKIESTILEESIKSNNNDNINHNQFYKRSQSAAIGSHYAQTNLSQTSHWFQNLGNYKDHDQELHQNGIELGHESSATLLDDVKPAKRGNYFVVLKPTNLSMLYDVLNLTSSKCWSAQQRLQLESQIVLHNSPSLFLEPDPSRLSSSPEPLCDDNGSHDKQQSCNWTSSEPATTVSSDACSNKYSRLNGSSHQRQLSHKTRLKSIYLNREIRVNHVKTNGNNNNNNTTSNHHPKMNNIYHNPSNNQRTGAIGILPPELTLQQFLASKRSTKKKSLPIGQSPRFHRYMREHK